jgi:hypothetical protein
MVSPDTNSLPDQWCTCLVCGPMFMKNKTGTVLVTFRQLKE